jgi:hypothetical protein
MRSTHAGHQRGRFLGVFGALVMALMVAPAVSASTAGIKFDLGLGNSCINGYNAGVNRTVVVEWRGADGTLKTKRSDVSDGEGWFEVCDWDEEVESGDVVKATRGQVTRTFTVPRLTGRADRDTDTVEGMTVPDADLAVTVYQAVGNVFDSATDYTTSAGDGWYYIDFWGVADLKGFDSVAITWSWNGDYVSRWTTVEGVHVYVGQPRVFIGGGAGQHVWVTLDNNLSLLGAAGGRVGSEGIFTRFTNDEGDSVKAAAGLWVTGDFASDAEFAIPNVTATVNKTTDRVTANCGLGPNVGVSVEVYDPVDYAPYEFRSGFTNGSGVFVANFATAPAANIAARHKVIVHCELESGDMVSRRITVP